MYTLKFESWDSVFPLHVGTNREQQAKTVALQEGEKIWRRPYQVRGLNEMELWKSMNGWSGIHTTCYIPGKDPTIALQKQDNLESNAKENSDTSPIHFEYLTFFDERGELWKVIIFCCNCYIMNETGQTVDSISA